MVAVPVVDGLAQHLEASMALNQPAVARSQDFDRYVPYQLAMRSDHLPWEGFRMEVVRGHAAGEVSLPPLDHHLLNVILAVPNRHVHRWGGVRAEQTGQEGAASLVPAGHDSYWRWRYLADGTPCDVHLHLQPTFVRRVAVESLCDLPPRVEFRPELCFSNSAVRTLTSALLEEMEVGAPNGPLYGESLATALVAALLTMQAPWRRHVARRTNLWPEMRAVCRYIEDHLEHPLHLAGLAAVVGLGPERFRHTFRAALGESPYRYVLRRRIDRARDMLRASSLPITVIAHRLGFADHSHLTSTFRRETGVTPSRFRAEARR